LSSVSDLIHKELQGQDIVVLPNGYRFALSEGHTDLTISPVQIEDDEWGLCEIISVRTVFKEGTYQLNPAQVAHLNGRSAFGSLYLNDGNLECKQSISIYKEEPASRWYALIILTSLGSQLPFVIGQIRSEASDESFRENRANLEFPRQWQTPPSPELFDVAAEHFQQMGLVSTSTSSGLVLEVPLTEESAPSRMMDSSSETALLHVSVDTPHPIAGVGYLSTIALPIDPADDVIVDVANKLNELEDEQLDFVPRLGSWCVRGMGNQLVYAMFWPTSTSDENMHSIMMNWMLHRTVWIRENFWESGKGVTIEGVNR
jgi:hypothetical protein